MEQNNLVLEGYGVKLTLLTHDKIEKLRQWRNDPKIQQYMVYRDYITPEMQERWFSKINNGVDNFYFMIEVKGQEIGMINVKDVDCEKGTGESGILIYEDSFLNSGVSVLYAHLLLFNYMFDVVGLNMIYAHTLRDNPRSIRTGVFIGYVIAPNQENVEHQMWQLTKEAYKTNSNVNYFLAKKK